MTNHLPGDERAGQKAWALKLMAGGSGAEEENEELRTRFSAAAPEGERLCACFSDEELLALLRAAGEKLGRSPAQGEVHWLLRDYLRARFRNWPGALRAAGMSRSAGRGGVSVQQAAREAGEVDQLLELVRTRAAALGRMPHPSELPEVCRKLSKRYKSWGQVLEAAGAEAAAAGALRKAADLTREEGRMLDELRTKWRELYGKEPPDCGKLLMRRQLAFRIQEMQYGGISESAQTALTEIGNTPKPRKNAGGILPGTMFRSMFGSLPACGGNASLYTELLERV